MTVGNETHNRDARAPLPVHTTHLCLLCGAGFSGAPHAAYCSRRCRARARTTGLVPLTRPCERCGAPFTKRAGARFCSHRCQERAGVARRRPPPSGGPGPRRRASGDAPGAPLVPALVRCDGCAVELVRTWRPAEGRLLCRSCYVRALYYQQPDPRRRPPPGPCSVCGAHGERRFRERRTGLLRCHACQEAFVWERYRATRRRDADGTVRRRGYLERALAVARGEWLPVAVLQQAIADAQAQRVARDAWRALRVRTGVPSPDEAVLYLLRRLFVAAVFAIPEHEAVLDEREPIAVSAPRIVRPDVRRAPWTRRGSAPLAEALLGLGAAGS